MNTKREYPTVITQEGDLYVAHCPELDIASQGQSTDEAGTMLAEAVELFLGSASPEEVKLRLQRW